MKKPKTKGILGVRNPTYVNISSLSILLDPFQFCGPLSLSFYSTDKLLSPFLGYPNYSVSCDLDLA